MNLDPFGPEFRAHVRDNVFTNPRSGAVWTERTIGDGHVERTYIDAPMRFGAQVGSTAELSPAVPAVVATPAPTTKAKPAKLEPVRRGTGGGTIEVRMSPAVVAKIRRSIIWDVDPADVREIGGWLIGTWTGEKVEIVDATTSAAKRKASSMTLDTVDWDMQLLKAEWGRGFGPIGCWHTHELDTGPSPQDFRSFENAWTHIREREGRFEPYTANLIVALQNGSRTKLDAVVYVTTQDNGRMVTEPGRLELA
jgi:hypothetical protein